MLSQYRSILVLHSKLTIVDESTVGQRSATAAVAAAASGTTLASPTMPSRSTTVVLQHRMLSDRPNSPM